MKHKIEQTKTTFNPITLTLVIESEEELDKLVVQFARMTEGIPYTLYDELSKILDGR